MAEAVERKLVKRVKHPKHDLYLLSYTKDTVAGHIWTQETKIARSLVVDGDYNIVSGCIPKFFNDFQDAESLKTSRTVNIYEKLDGSLISLFVYEGELIVRSKSVWESPLIDQVHAFLSSQDTSFLMNSLFTYVCEWIHPANRHIVNYGGRVDLVLLAAIPLNQDDGWHQYTPENVFWPWGRVRNFSLDFENNVNLDELRGSIPDGEEGYVLWDVNQNHNNTRTKIKSYDYLRLHRIKYNLTPKSMLEIIKEGDEQQIQRMLDTINDLDETTATFLLGQYESMVHDINSLTTRIRNTYNSISNITDRKLFAQSALTQGQDVAGGCFILQDGRDLRDYVFRGVDLKKYNDEVKERMLA